MQASTWWRAAAVVAGMEVMVMVGSAALPLEGRDPGIAQGPAGVEAPAGAPPGTGGAGTTAEIVAGAGEDLLDFTNNDRLHGQLLAIGPAPSGLRWKSRECESPIDFGLSGIGRITLAKRESGTAPVLSGAMVYLSNGDMLLGTVVTMDDEKLVLNTWYAGTITIKRAMIKSLVPSGDSGQRVFEGPTEMESWTVFRRNNVPSWRYKNGALYALNTYPIGRNFPELPDRAEIEFEASWRFDYPAFMVAFFTDNLQQQQGNCYVLLVSGNSIYMQRWARNGGNESMWQMNYDQFGNGRKNRARFTLLVDKARKSFALLIDGQVFKQWTDNNNFAGQGKGLLFQSQSQGGLKIAKIRIADWDGTLPQVGGVVRAESKVDVLRFVNNDLVSGTVKSIAEGKMKFETSYAPLDIPLERIAEVQMAAERMERARRNKLDVRLLFATRGLVTLNLQSVVSNEVKGVSENMGDLKLPLSALQSLDMNIYRERVEDEGLMEDLF